MPKIIVTSRYLKSGAKKKLANYVKYIATREGSVPTVSERENYVGYLANRPGTVKLGSHGLFSQSDSPINLEKTAKEIADHVGNVWTHVVSLRREDAQKMGYDNLTAWHDLVIRQIPNIAKHQKIDLANLKWYAAFHDKETNPHVHIIVYSTNEREGFLTNHGIEKIRSGFANDIYQDELLHLYQQQTDLRNLLKKESAELMQKLASDISSSAFSDAELLRLVAKLHEQLVTAKGKKTYGYLKPEIKRTVDEIFSHLAENESIRKMYALWCELEQQKHDVYSSAKVQFPSLADNKEFKSVKNMIVRTVMQMQFPVIEIEETEIHDPPEPEIYDMVLSPPFDSIFPDNLQSENLTEEHVEKFRLKWSDNYKTACKIIYDKQSKMEDFRKAEQLLLSEAESGNALVMFELGKLYASEKLGKKDVEKSVAFYQKALQGFLLIEPKTKKIKPFLQYQIGRMYMKGLGTDLDMPKAITHFQSSAKLGNMRAKRIVAMEYISGEYLEQDVDKGISMLTECADSGDKLSCYKLGKIYLDGKITAQDFDKAEKYLLASDKNEYTFYVLGKLYLTEEKHDVQRAVSYFEQCSDTNPWASYWLGKIYLFGCEEVPQNREKALEYLTFSAEQDNGYAQNIFDNMEQYQSEMLTNTIFSLFVNLSKCLSEDYNQKFQSGRISVDKKLRRMMQEKKQALGMKEERTQTQEQSY